MNAQRAEVRQLGASISSLGEERPAQAFRPTLRLRFLELLSLSVSHTRKMRI
jgi:hypothetical protein